MKRIFLLIALIFVVFVGSANTISPLSKLINGTINNKVSNTDSHHYVRNYNNNFEINNTNNTPPCDVTANISYAGAPFCSSTTTPQSVTLTGTGVFTGGVFTSTVGLTINSNTGAITPSTSTSGSYTVTYTVSGGIGCPDAVATTTVAINTVPVVANQNITVCSDLALGVNLNSSSTVTAATYNITNINSNGVVQSAGNPVTGTGLLSNVIANDAWTNTSNAPVNVIYTVVPVSATGCQGNPFTVTVTVNAIPVIFNKVIPLCNDNSGFIFNPTNGLDGIVQNNTTYVWTVIDNPNVFGEVNQNIPQLSISIPPLFNNSSSVQTIVYVVTPISSLGCIGANFTITVNLNHLPPANNLTLYLQRSCQFQQAIPLSAGNYATIPISYQWYKNGTLINGATNQTYIPDTTILGTNTYNCKVVFSTGQCDYGYSFPTEFTVVPAITITTQPLAFQTACLNSTLTPLSFIVTNGNGTPTYQWYSNTINSTTGSTAIAGANNASYTPLTTSLGSIFYYCVATYPSGTCTTSTSSIAEVVVVSNQAPVIPAQQQTICSGTSFTVTPANALPTTIVPAGTTYTWTVVTNASVTGTSNSSVGQNNINQTLTNSTNIPQTVVYTVTPQVGNCVTGAPFTLTVTVNPRPNVPNQTVTVCSGNSFTVSPVNMSPSTIVPLNTTYTWTVIDNPIVTGEIVYTIAQPTINQTLTNLTNNPQTVVYTVTPISGAAGNCIGLPFTLTVTVNPTPVIRPQTATICSGGTFAVIPVNTQPSTIVPFGTTYTWTVVDNVNVSGESNQSVPQTTLSQTLVNLTNTPQTVVYTVTPRSGAAGTCSGASFTVTVTVNLRPVVPLQSATICSGLAFSVSPANAPPNTIVPSGTTYTWTVAPNANVSGQSNQVNAQTSISQTLTNLLPDPSHS